MGKTLWTTYFIFSTSYILLQHDFEAFESFFWVQSKKKRHFDQKNAGKSEDFLSIGVPRTNWTIISTWISTLDGCEILHQLIQYTWFIHVYPITSRVSTCFNHPFGGAEFRNHPQCGNPWWRGDPHGSMVRISHFLLGMIKKKRYGMTGMPNFQALASNIIEFEKNI